MAESWRSGRSDKLAQKSGFITKDCESYRIGQLGLEAEICFTVDCSRAIGAPGPLPTFTRLKLTSANSAKRTLPLLRKYSRPNG